MKGKNQAMVTGQIPFLWLMLKRIQIPLVLRMNCQRQFKETEKPHANSRENQYEVYLELAKRHKKIEKQIGKILDKFLKN